MKSSLLAGGILVAAFVVAPALAAPETAETDGNDDPSQVEGMSPEESEQQLEATPDPIDQARVETDEREPFGRYLTNQDGKSLYMFEQDEQGGDYSTCYESCAIAWPPYTTEEPPAAGEHVDADRLGVIEREDGTQQVTYDGWPLYFFARDVYPGDALGQGLEHMGGPWYLISPEGEILKEAPAEQAEPVEP
ncbi:COG4315 family predicted lipoprotein [Billgrantia sp. Q4P2]|uniref:COG4315 family predicted lipoprotein n=1 Tax=Billgrantia sp. Q4P2 TaxID=3463857 RepID=UPI00405705CA